MSVHLWFVAEARLVNLHNICVHRPTSSQGHIIMINQSPTADFPQPLVNVHCCSTCHLTFTCSLRHRILPHPPINEKDKLLERDFRLFKESAQAQRHRLLTSSNWAPPSILLFLVCNLYYNSSIRACNQAVYMI